jgi:hypothetical protein
VIIEGIEQNGMLSYILVSRDHTATQNGKDYIMAWEADCIKNSNTKYNSYSPLSSTNSLLNTNPIAQGLTGETNVNLGMYQFKSECIS